jgi:hypothetical protein
MSHIYVHDFYILDSTSTTISGTGSNIGIKPGLTIYPNPTRDFIFLDNKTSMDAEFINMMGQKILATHDVTGKIDVSQVPAGIYCLKLTDEGGDTNVYKVTIDPH